MKVSKKKQGNGTSHMKYHHPSTDYIMQRACIQCHRLSMSSHSYVGTITIFYYNTISLKMAGVLETWPKVRVHRWLPLLQVKLSHCKFVEVYGAHVRPGHGNRCWYCAMPFVRKMLLIGSNLDAQAYRLWRKMCIMQIPSANSNKLTDSTKDLDILLGCVHSQCLWPTGLQKRVHYGLPQNLTIMKPVIWGSVSCIWHVRLIKESSLLCTVTGDKTWVNHAAFATNQPSMI